MATVQARTLKRAADILGGEEQLARKLRVTPSHLARWIEGLADPPANVFLAAVDIVTEHDSPNPHEPPQAPEDGDSKSPTG